MFNISGDCNWRHNYNCQPALPLPIGIMFITGIAWSIYQIWTSARKRAHWRRLSPAIPDTNIAEKANTTSRIPQADSIIENKSDNSWSFSQVALFLFVWFFVMLLPEILTNEGLPHSLRSIGAIPVVYIFAGFGGWWIINKLKTNSKKQKAALIILGIIFCLWLILYSYNLYFIQWGQNPETKGAFTQNLVDIGNYLNSLPDEGVKKYVVVNEGGVPVPYPNGIPMPAQTIMFIEQTKPHQRQTHYLIPDELVNFHGLNAKANYSLVFVLMRYDENVLNELKNRAPNGIIKQEESNIWTFQIKN
jgi:hypothetical protein